MLRNSSVRKKKENPISPRAGGQQKPAFPGLSPLPTQVLRVGMWGAHSEPWQAAIGFLSKLVPCSSLPCSGGQRGHECTETAFSRKPQLFGKERRHRGVCKLRVTPSPNVQGRRQRAPPSRQKSPFFSIKR